MEAINTKTVVAMAYQTPAAAPVSTTSAAAFDAARGRGQFGRYGFDGVSQALVATPLMSSPAKPISALGWVAKLYPSDFVPKSLAGRMLLAPLGLLMLAASAFKTTSMPTEVGPLTQNDVFAAGDWRNNPANPCSPMHEDYLN